MNLRRFPPGMMGAILAAGTPRVSMTGQLLDANGMPLLDEHGMPLAVPPGELGFV
jgi:hypothetical protein